MLDLRPGAVVSDKLRLVRPLGQGGMGRVWLARHLTLDTDVAVKFIRPERAAADPSLLTRFAREARAAAKISSPHVVQIKDLGAAGEDPYIVMELLEGEPLSELLARQGPLALGHAVAILVDVAEALESAHGQGVVHRDVKPANIFLARLGPSRVLTKVLDFGVAKILGETQVPGHGTELTQTGTVIGSPPYMSPEQLEGRFDVDHRADLWSLGVVAYQMLTGALPFAGGSFVAVGAAVLAGVYPPATHLQPALPATIDDWFARALCLDRHGRFASARQLAEALVAVLARHRASARRASPEVEASGSPLPALRFAPDEPLGDATTEEQLARRPEPETEPHVPARGREDEVVTEDHAGPLAPPEDAPPVDVAEPRSEPRGLRWRPLAGAVAALAMVGGALTLLAIGRAPRSGPEPTPSVAQVVATPTTCPAGMVFIPGGPFDIGSVPAPETRTDETPRHTVQVAAFCLDETEVTVADYAACSSCEPAASTVDWEGITPRVQTFWSRFCHADAEARRDHPANCLDWDQASAFCRQRGARLPTEAEWELAARGRDGRVYPWGNAPPASDRLNACGSECAGMLTRMLRELGDTTWSGMYDDDDGFSSTAPARRYPAGVSPYGVHDMAGNVWEWTSSPYCPYDRPGCGDSRRVLRGGGWNSPDVTDVRVARRHPGAPRGKSYNIGFRCAWPEEPRGGA